MTEKDTKKKDNAKKFWDSVSKRFGKPNQTTNSPALLSVKQHSDKYFKSTDTILDFGCGTGDITLEIAGKTRKVTGIDYSDGMIDAAIQKAKEQNSGNVDFLKTDLFDINFLDHSFDVVTAFNVLHYISDKKRNYSKVYELLKPQGLFISSTACLGERYSLLRFLMAILTTIGVVPKMISYKKSDLENEIEKAGFSIVAAFDIAKLPERFIVAKKD